MNSYFADIMEHSAPIDKVHLFTSPVKCFSEQSGDLSHPARMTLGIGITCFYGVRHPPDGIKVAALEAVKEVGILQGEREKTGEDIEKLQGLLPDEILILFKENDHDTDGLLLVGERCHEDAQ